MYRSFASLRMTTKRNVVILSEAKDLYTSLKNNAEFCAVIIEESHSYE